MGWPKFDKCCGCVPLTTGIVIIGFWILVFSLVDLAYNSVLLTYGIQHNQLYPDDRIPMIGWVSAALLIMKDVLKAAIAITIIISRKNAKYLERLLFYMIAMCIADMFVVIFTLSVTSSIFSFDIIGLIFKNFFNAFLIFLNFYFVFIVRSTQLQLQRNTDPVDDQRRTIDMESNNQGNGSNFVESSRMQLDRRLTDEYRQRSLSQESAVHQTNELHQPPPPYEEAVRHETLVIPNISAALRSTTQDAEDERDLAVETTPIEVENVQPEATNSNAHSEKKEPECVLYDEGQFRAIINAQLVERRSPINE